MWLCICVFFNSAAVQIRTYVTINFFFTELHTEALCTKSMAHRTMPRMLSSCAASGSTAIASRLVNQKAVQVSVCVEVSLCRCV